MEVSLTLPSHIWWVLADQMQHRDTVVVGSGHGGDRVERTGSVRGERHPLASRCPRVSVGHEHCRLFVSDFDVPELGMVDECVVHGQGAHPRDAEEKVDSLGEKALDQDVSAASCHRQQDPVPPVADPR